MDRKITLLHSGGLDSYVAGAMLIEQGYDVNAITFDYGQATMPREYQSARRFQNWASDAYKRFMPLDRMTLFDYEDMVKRHPLVTGNAPAVGADERDVIFIPGRNIVFLLFAALRFYDEGITNFAIAAHKSDITSGDCQPEFLTSLSRTLSVGLAFAGRPRPYQVLSPLIDMTKAEVVQKAVDLGVPIRFSWSCYNAGDKHCGVCHNCEDRKEAFKEAGVPDQTEYAA